MDVPIEDDPSPPDVNVLRTTWKFNFLCCYNTGNGEPRSHQAWKPAQESDYNDYLSLAELFRDPIPEWSYLIKRWLAAPTSEKVPWMRHRFIQHAMEIVNRYRDRANELSPIDQECEFNTIIRYMGSDSSRLVHLMTCGLLRNTLDPWEILYPGPKDEVNSELLALEFIKLSMTKLWAPSRPVRRYMITGEEMAYILPLSVLPLSEDWLDQDRYLQQCIFPEVPLSVIFPVPQERVDDINIPAHSFCQAKTHPWARTLMTRYHRGLSGEISMFPNPFHDTDIHGQQQQDHPRAFVPGTIPIPLVPVYTNKSMFLRPHVMGYELNHDPYHLQKITRMTNWYNHQYPSYQSWLRKMALVAPHSHLGHTLSDEGGILALYDTWMKKFEARHLLYYNKPAKPLCVLYYYDLTNAGCFCGPAQPRTLAETCARVINNLVVYTSSEADPVMTMTIPYRPFHREIAIKSDLWIAFEDITLGLPNRLRAFLRFVHSAGYQLFSMGGGSEELRGRRGAWQGSSQFEPSPEYLYRNRFLRGFNSHLEMESREVFHGPTAATSGSHCFCLAAGCWCRDKKYPELSPQLFSCLNMWLAHDVRWQDYINTGHPLAVERLELVVNTLVARQAANIKDTTPLDKVLEHRQEADAVWDEIVSHNQGQFSKGNKLRDLKPWKQVGFENRPASTYDFKYGPFWNFLRAWTADRSPPLAPPTSRRQLRVEWRGKLFLITSQFRYGYTYDVTEISKEEWTTNHRDKPVISHMEARELTRERGEELYCNGYMDREIWSQNTSSNSDTSGGEG